jgi:hypothetical protein
VSSGLRPGRVGQEASAMDGSQFDQLIKRLGTTRITRLTALRGLAVGALAATLGFAAPDGADAKCKKCNECQIRKKKKTNSGKTRCKCKAKANGTLCSLGTCQSGTCTRSVTPLTPVPATCRDGVKNGRETDVDCGGPDCPPCAVGRGCLSRSDCASAICTGTCQACVPGAVCAAGGVCTCVLPNDAATTTCVALPAPPAMAGSCPGSCPAGTFCIGSAGLVLCTDPCTAP